MVSCIELALCSIEVSALLDIERQATKLKLPMLKARISAMLRLSLKRSENEFITI
jgi:hypothetical protein